MKYWTTLQKLMWLKRASGGSQEYSGDIVQFETAKAKKLKNLIVNLSPIQDLHGYDAPWAGGAGKNKLPLIWQNGSAVTTVNGVTLTINDDGTITGTGTASAQTDIYFSRTNGSGTFFNAVSVPTGTCVFSAIGLSAGITAITSGGGGNGFPYSVLTSENTSVSGNVSDGSIPFNYFLFRIASGTNVSGTYKVQLESGSTATSWVPYSNVCPITGRTGASAYLGAEYDPDTATLYSVQFTDGDDPLTVYSGTIDLVTGDGVMDMAKIKLTSSDQIMAYQFRTYNGVYVANKITESYNRAVGLCNCSGKVGNYYDENSIWVGANDKYVYWIGILDVLGLSDVSEFKTWLDSNEVEICYELAEPIPFHVDPQEILSLVGENVIWSPDGQVTVRV